MNPTISIIIPIYNAEVYLDECIQSVRNQTYKDLEIILVDDGSFDRCPQMCDEYAKLDLRIKVMHIMNGGVSNARNVGLDVATGEYIGFVDCDDIIQPNMYEELLHKINECQTDIMCGSFTLYYNGEDMPCTWGQEGYIEGKIISLKEYFKEIVCGSLDNAAWNKLYKKDILNIRFKKGVINEEYLFFAQLAKNFPDLRIAFTTKTYYKYRQHRDGSLCNNRIKLEAAILDNMADTLLDIDNWYVELRTEIQKQRDRNLYKMIERLAWNYSLREKNKPIFKRFHKEFKKTPYSRFNTGRMNVAVLKYLPNLYHFYMSIKTKLYYIIKC